MSSPLSSRTSKTVLSSIAAITMCAGVLVAGAPTAIAAYNPTTQTCGTDFGEEPGSFVADGTYDDDGDSAGGSDTTPTPLVPVPVGNGWRFDGTEGVWFAPNFEDVSVLTLTSPTYTVDAGTQGLGFTLVHSWDTEEDYDGGILQVSVDGGDFATLSPDAYSTGAPNAAIDGQSNPYDGVPAWSGYGQATSIGLVPASPGDTVQLRFLMTTDASSSETGWTLNSLTITNCAGESGDETPAPEVTGFDVSISGEAGVGEPLTAVLPEGIDPAPGDGDVTYEWFTEQTEPPIEPVEPFATGQTITVPSSVTGQRLFVRASYSPDDYEPVTADSDLTEPVAVLAPIQGLRVAIDDTTPVVGQVLSIRPDADEELSDANRLTSSVQWLKKAPNSSATLPIEGATDPEYTVLPEDLGSTFKVRYTANVDDRRPTTVLSAATSAVAKGQIATTKPAKISGVAKVGRTLTAVAPETVPAETGVAYQWQVDTGAGYRDISGEDGAELEIPAAAVGGTIRVAATLTAPGYETSTVYSAASDTVRPVAAGLRVALDDTTPVVGQTLSVRPDVDEELDASTTSTAVAWYAKAANQITAQLVQAGGTEYTVVPADLGKTITAKYTVSLEDGTGQTVTTPASSPVTKGAFTVGEKPAVSGTAKVGRTLSAVDPQTTPGAATTTYQWQVEDGTDFVDIAGASASTLTVPASAVGSPIRVAVTLSASGYDPTTSYSVASDPVQPGTLNGYEIGFDGQTQVGQTLTADAGETSQGSTPTYAWQLQNGSSWDTVATSATYDIPASAVGRRVRLQVTFSAPGYTDATDTSTSSVITAAPFAGAPSVRASGIAVVGHTLTASVTGASSPAASSYALQWFAGSSPIAGATQSTLLLTPALAGQPVTLRATPVLIGYDGSGQVGTSNQVGIRAAAPTVTASDRSVKAGQRFIVTGADLRPGARYSVQLAGRTVRSGIVGESGTISHRVRFPKATSSRRPVIRIVVTDGSGTVVTNVSTRVSYRR